MEVGSNGKPTAALIEAPSVPSPHPGFLDTVIDAPRVKPLHQGRPDSFPSMGRVNKHAADPWRPIRLVRKIGSPQADSADDGVALESQECHRHGGTTQVTLNVRNPSLIGATFKLTPLLPVELA